MKLSRSPFVLFVALCLAPLGWAQAPASLLITTDTACDWKLDGQSQGRLNVDDAKVVHTTAGEHLLQATSAEGQLKWQGMVTADPAAQKMIKIPLSDAPPTWKDPATGLMWTKSDNGSNVNWNQASAYCSSLRLGGYSDWRLATIDELQSIYDPNANVNNWRVKGNLKLSGGHWSSSAGNASGEAWRFNFDSGKRFSNLLGYSFYIRALCVRRSGE
jgi:hypothetical protein